MLPFTQSEFFAVFAAYNAAVWPIQIVAYLLGGVGVLALARPSRAGETSALIILGAMWAWTGIAYHGLFFSGISQAAYVFAAAFVIQAALLLYAAARRDRLGLRFSASASGALGIALLAYAAAIYPLIGWLSGHRYAASPAFGITPCPVTIFTFGILLLAQARVPWWLVAIPFAWSLIGGSAAFLLGVPQDWILLLSGILATPLLLRGRRTQA